MKSSGKVDVDKVLDMVTTADNPTVKKDFFDLHYVIKKTTHDATTSHRATKEANLRCQSKMNELDQQLDKMVRMLDPHGRAA